MLRHVFELPDNCKNRLYRRTVDLSTDPLVFGDQQRLGSTDYVVAERVNH